MLAYYFCVSDTYRYRSLVYIVFIITCPQVTGRTLKAWLCSFYRHYTIEMLWDIGLYRKIIYGISTN